MQGGAWHNLTRVLVVRRWKRLAQGLLVSGIVCCAYTGPLRDGKILSKNLRHGGPIRRSLVLQSTVIAEARDLRRGEGAFVSIELSSLSQTLPRCAKRMLS